MNCLRSWNIRSSFFWPAICARVAFNLEETEAITVHRMPRHEAVLAALQGDISDAVTGIAILRADALISR